MRRGRNVAAVSLAALLVIGLWSCGKTGNSAPSPKGILSFEDDGASWVSTGNYFAKLLRPTQPIWLGVLFQFGKFTDNAFKGEVQFLDADNNPITIDPIGSDGWLTPSEFTWINIVSTREGGGVPVLPNEVLVLFPNGRTNPCDMGSSGNNCLRDRRIHWDQKPIDFIITYWEGDKGFTVDAQPIWEVEGGDAYHRLRHDIKFRLRDDFAVAVYKLNAASDGMDEVKTWNVGDVKTITVKNTDIGTGTPHSGKHDPPWIQ